MDPVTYNEVRTRPSMFRIEKYHYFLKYLKRYPQYGGTAIFSRWNYWKRDTK